MTAARLRAGCALVALVCTLVPAVGHAQDLGVEASAQPSAERNLYEARYGIEYANGFTSYAETKRMRVARERRGDESLITYNVLDGSAVAVNDKGSIGQPLRYDPGAVIDQAYRYDYAKRELHGPEAFAAYFNKFIRPKLPDAKRGEPGRWTIPVTMVGLGLAKLGNASAELIVERRFVDHGGHRYALVSFEIPAFDYVMPTGEKTVHWSRGAAIADADFGTVYYLVARHRGLADAGAPGQRPLSAKEYNFATDKEGNPLLSLDGFTEANALMDAASVGMDGDAGPRIEPVADADIDRALDHSFFEAVGALTPLAFSAAEQGANQLGTTGAATATSNQAENGSVIEMLSNAFLIGDPEVANAFKKADDAQQYYLQLKDSISEARATMAAARSSLRASPRLAPGPQYPKLLAAARAAVEAGDVSKGQRLLAQAAKIDDAMFARMEAKYADFYAAKKKLSELVGPKHNAEWSAKGSASYEMGMAERSVAGRLNKVVKGFNALGTAANAANSSVLLYHSMTDDAMQFTSVRGGTYDEQAQEYLNSRGNRLMWQLIDIGLSAATGDVKNAAISSVGIVAQTAGDTRAAYSGVLDSRYQQAAAEADLRLTEYRRLRNGYQQIGKDITSAGSDLDELKRLLQQLEQLDRQRVRAESGIVLAPEEPQLSDAEHIAALVDAINNSGGKYPTLTQAQKDAIHKRAVAEREAKKARESGSLNIEEINGVFDDLYGGAFDGDFGDLGEMREPWPEYRDPEDDLLLQGILGGLNPDWLKGSDEFTDEDLARLAILQGGADTTPQKVSDQVRSMSISDFAMNNAFQYNNMSGIVPTDLSKYQEWLATQDVAKLERLARQAGYPNLASALADAANLLKQADDNGWRRWALAPPSCSGLAGCGPQFGERWAAKRSRLALGDILAMDRSFFSTAGLTDVQIAGLTLAFVIADFGVEDGDVVSIAVRQFGQVLLSQTLSTTNAGNSFSVKVNPGVVSVQMKALNEGAIPPNTAGLTIQNVAGGNADQQYSLSTGEEAGLRVTVGG